jgi:formylmethanofuran dehydrogenase subunit E
VRDDPVETIPIITIPCDRCKEQFGWPKNEKPPQDMLCNRCRAFKRLAEAQGLIDNALNLIDAI